MIPGSLCGGRIPQSSKTQKVPGSLYGGRKGSSVQAHALKWNNLGEVSYMYQAPPTRDRLGQPKDGAVVYEWACGP